MVRVHVTVNGSQQVLVSVGGVCVCVCVRFSHFIGVFAEWRKKDVCVVFSVFLKNHPHDCSKNPYVNLIVQLV